MNRVLTVMLTTKLVSCLLASRIESLYEECYFETDWIH